MEKFRKLYRALMKRPLGFAIISNIITFVLGCLCFRPFFEEVDDLILSNIAEGVYGSRDAHLIYINIILGKLITFLQSIVPSIRWHVVLMMLFSFIALTLLTYILSGYKYGRSVSVIAQIGLFYELYVSIQFTKTATFICAVGVFAILYCISLMIWGRRINKKTGEPRKFAGIMTVSYILLLYSMLLRDGAFAIGIVFSAVLGLVIFIAGISKAGPRSIGYFAICFLPVIVVFLIVSAIDSSAYNSDPEWNYFLEYNRLRTQIVDYRYDLLDYSAHGDELSKMGVSENDAYMYLTWQFADEEVVNPEYMNGILGMSGVKKIDLDMLKAWVANLYDALFVMQPVILATLILLFAIVFGRRGSFYNWLFAAGQTFLFVVVSFYYQYSGRWSRRLLFSALCALIVTLAGYIVTMSSRIIEQKPASDSFKESSGEKKIENIDIGTTFKVSIAILLVLFVGVRIGNEFDYQKYLRSEKDFAVLQMYMEEEKDTLFVADTYTVSDRYRYNVFDAQNEGVLDNFVATGGWITASPIEHRVVEKYGYYDPFDALKRGDNVILIDNICPDRKALFLSEHGDGPRFASEYLETVCGYNLYRVK